MHEASIHNVTLRLGDRVILDQVSLRARAATVVAVTGPSGSGKTTLLHVLGGLLLPNSGTVTSPENTDRIAWIVQNSPLLSRRTCQENVALGALSNGVEWGRAQSAAEAILGELGLAHVASSVAYRLSGGEKQRVAVGRAIATGAPVVLADEPTASLDADARALVCSALRRAADGGSAVLVTTHDAYVADAADEVFRLDRGRIAAKLEAR